MQVVQVQVQQQALERADWLLSHHHTDPDALLYF
jgi:hypothetical protein